MSRRKRKCTKSSWTTITDITGGTSTSSRKVNRTVARRMCWPGSISWKSPGRGRFGGRRGKRLARSRRICCLVTRACGTSTRRIRRMDRSRRRRTGRCSRRRG
uniref:(northern house mosquito) hypothetical protein n=1 Tax=Culex pipiens TaxID=7175 RepID=A0A8D8KEE3_CULPI